MKEPEVNLDLAIEHGLNEEEYNRILKILGRTPSFTELGIFSVMWSEHCSYKNSIALLKTLPREGVKLLVGAGEENAGLVDIGDNLAVAFKIESHNHPSAVEPYQGAATGVGGIMRDIFTMGARPIASLNSTKVPKLVLRPSMLIDALHLPLSFKKLTPLTPDVFAELKPVFIDCSRGVTSRKFTILLSQPSWLI